MDHFEKPLLCRKVKNDINEMSALKMKIIFEPAAAGAQPAQIARFDSLTSSFTKQLTRLMTGGGRGKGAATRSTVHFSVLDRAVL